MAAAEKKKLKIGGTGNTVAGVALVLFSLLMLTSWRSQPLPLSPGQWVARLLMAEIGRAHV